MGDTMESRKNLLLNTVHFKKMMLSISEESGVPCALAGTDMYEIGDLRVALHDDCISITGMAFSRSMRDASEARAMVLEWLLNNSSNRQGII